MDNDATFKKFLPKISAGNREHAKRALAILAARFKKPADSIDDDDVNAAIETLGPFIGPSDSQINRLSAFEDWADATQLQPLLNKLSSQINNYMSAISAIENCDIDWFITLPLSNTAKQQVAATLNTLTMQYAKSNNDFWLKLINGDGTMMDAVSFRYNTENQ